MAATLLLVDDDAAFRERLALSLRRRGYEVHPAANLSEVLQLAAEHPFQGAVIDLRLAEESGLDIVHHLTHHHPKTRLLLLTGYGSIATAVEAVRLGAIDYLTKPADTDQIEAALFPPTPDSTTPNPPPPPGTPNPEVPSLARVEWEHLQRVLLDCKGNISEAARRLGIERRTLQRKLKKYPPTH